MLLLRRIPLSCFSSSLARRDVIRTVVTKPTIAMAKAQKTELWELDNDILLVLSRDSEAHDVHQERLIRDIMAVDNIPYDDAEDVMKAMFKYNQLNHMWMLPYDFTLISTGAAAVVCVPLVFDFEAAKAFADLVSASSEEVPAVHSAANVGSWTWTWMEPMIGTASFSILCLQLFKGVMQKLALRPYHDSLQSKRANRLSKAYPTYTKSIVKDFGRSQPLRGNKFNPLGSTW